MKQAIVTSYTFNAAAKTIDLSSIAGFDVKKLYAIINVTANQIIYATGTSQYGLANIAGSVITLNYNTAAMNNTDKLQIFYDDISVNATQSGTWNIGTLTEITNVVHVDDNASSLTVDDGGGSITIDGTVAVSGSVAVTGSFYQATQPVSATSLPLPTGAATSAKQPNFGTAGTPSADVVSVQGVTGGNLLGVEVNSAVQSGYSPNPASYDTGTVYTPILDASSRLETHSSVTTDEGSYRDDFVGSSLTNALTGTLSFTNNGLTVTGSGTLFTTEIYSGDFIKKTADSETLFVEVESVDSDTSLTLASPYQGTTGSSTAIESKWITSTGSGATISVASSAVAIASGTTNGATTYIKRKGDYLPYTSQFYFSVSQRIANQTLRVGFMDDFANPTIGAYVQFTGTNTSQATFVTRSSANAADTQSTTFNMPNGAATSSFNTYKIDVSGSSCNLLVNNVVVATNQIHIPGPYSLLNIIAGVTNAAAVTSTTLSLDVIYFYNSNRTQIDNDFLNESINVNVTTPFIKSGQDIDTFGAAIAHGRVSQLFADYSQALTSNDVTSTVSGGTVTQANGSATLATGTGTTASASLKSNATISYSPGREAYAVFTAAFTVGTSTGQNQRIGLYDASNGFFVGYQDTVFGITWRQNGVDTFYPQAQFNGDVLSGLTNSQFTRGGVPEAINTTFKNVFRIRFGWLGVAPVKFEVLSPDGPWILMHTIKYPNTAVNPHLFNTALPIQAEVTKATGGATNLTISTSSWDAGVVNTADVDLSYVFTIAANGATATSNTTTKSTISFNFTGTWVGTMVIEAHNGDQGWQQINSYTNAGAAVSQITTNTFVYVDCAAFTQVRVRATAWTSGTANIQSNASKSAVFVFNTPAIATTYSATSAIAFNAANNATDIFTITGSATKIIKVLRVGFSATQTTAGTANVLLVKRSTANSAGTSAAATAIPHDSNDVAATATVLNYTANPTVGTAVGTIRAYRAFIPAPATASTVTYYEFTFGSLPEKAVVLRGTGQVLALNLNATTITGNAFTCFVEWTEE